MSNHPHRECNRTSPALAELNDPLESSPGLQGGGTHTLIHGGGGGEANVGPVEAPQGGGEQAKIETDGTGGSSEGIGDQDLVVLRAT
jgi:hypothetical protein